MVVQQVTGMHTGSYVIVNIASLGGYYYSLTQLPPPSPCHRTHEPSYSSPHTLPIISVHSRSHTIAVLVQNTIAFFHATSQSVSHTNIFRFSLPHPIPQSTLPHILRQSFYIYHTPYQAATNCCTIFAPYHTVVHTTSHPHHQTTHQSQWTTRMLQQLTHEFLPLFLMYNN